MGTRYTENGKVIWSEQSLTAPQPQFPVPDLQFTVRTREEQQPESTNSSPCRPGPILVPP